MKILVVEDDPIVARILQDLLSSHHYAVDIAADGETGLQMARAFDYDLMTIDIGLPGLDGISLCRQLRDQGSQTPILLLTGQLGDRQTTTALNAGADDFVLKPFNIEELMARVQALLRRGGPKTQPILTWGELSVDPISRRATYGTQLLSVTPKEYALLELFLRNPQRVFSAHALVDQIWSSAESPGEEAVRVHIKELRKKLKGVGAAKDFIKTVYGAGYRLNPMYASSPLSQASEQMIVEQLAELRSLNEELGETIAELNQRNRELAIACQTLEQEKHQLQTVRTNLEQQLTACITELNQIKHQHQRENHQSREHQSTANAA